MRGLGYRTHPQIFTNGATHGTNLTDLDQWLAGTNVGAVWAEDLNYIMSTYSSGISMDSPLFYSRLEKLKRMRVRLHKHTLKSSLYLDKLCAVNPEVTVQTICALVSECVSLDDTVPLVAKSFKKAIGDKLNSLTS